MKVRLTLNRMQRFSFEDDIDMLGRLLCMIIDFFETTSCTEISMNEIGIMTKNLDCNTHTSVVRRVLIQKGFLTGTMWSFKLLITPENRKTIELFFMNHTNVFQGSYMTQKDWAHIYGASGIQGSEIETLLAQVMGPLAALMGHFERVQKLQSDHEANYAKRVTNECLDKLHMKIDHARATQLFTELKHATEEYGPGSAECAKALLHFKKAEAVAEESIARERESGRLCALVARDGKILEMLKAMHVLLDQVVSTLSKKEREI